MDTHKSSDTFRNIHTNTYMQIQTHIHIHIHRHTHTHTHTDRHTHTQNIHVYMQCTFNRHTYTETVGVQKLCSEVHTRSHNDEAIVPTVNCPLECYFLFKISTVTSSHSPTLHVRNSRVILHSYFIPVINGVT